MLVSLFTGSVVMSLYCIVPWPSWLAKITLFCMSQSERAVLGAGIFNLLLLLYALHLSEKKIPAAWSMVSAVFLSIGSIFWLKGQYPDLYSKRVVLVSLLLFFFGSILVLLEIGRKKCRFLALYSLIIAVVGGMTVNPVHSGADAIFENPAVKAIQGEAEKDTENGLWIVENMGNPYINLPITVGAPTINCTNTYPAMERWKKLDPEGKYKDVYNRYAHIRITLNRKDKTTMKNKAVDTMDVSLAVKDLKTLNVKHIFTNRLLEKYEMKDISFHMIKQVGNYFIYNVVYE